MKTNHLYKQIHCWGDVAPNDRIQIRNKFGNVVIEETTTRSVVETNKPVIVHTPRGIFSTAHYDLFNLSREIDHESPAIEQEEREAKKDLVDDLRAWQR